MSVVKEKGWGVFPQDNGDFVILPIDDKRKHDAASRECPCEPRIDTVDGRLIFVHNAFDFRHVIEWIEWYSL